MSRLLAIFRLIVFAFYTIGYVMLVLIMSLFVGDKTKASENLRRPTIKLFLYFLGIRIHQSGKIPDKTVLFVGNHISYMDPFVLVYHTIAWPVAKSEIASWPLIGYAVSLSGVLFVKRNNASSLKATRDAIAQTLADGHSVIVYPEGTTSDGQGTLSFRRGVFDIACDNGFPVCPVTIYFKNKEAPYIRKQKFLPHFLMMFGAWRNHVYIHFGDTIQKSDGKECMENSKFKIEEQLAKYRDEIIRTN